MTRERWVAVPGYEGLYEVSDLGRVRSLDRLVPHSSGKAMERRLGRVLKQSPEKRGYLFVSRIVGPTLMIPTGGNAVATVALPGADPHLEWSLRYGSPEAVRFSAAGVIETFDYLLSDNINMTEATRRLRILRSAVRAHVSGVKGPDHG